MVVDLLFGTNEVSTSFLPKQLLGDSKGVCDEGRPPLGPLFPPPSVPFCPSKSGELLPEDAAKF
jgi:hypothetical protein